MGMSMAGEHRLLPASWLCLALLAFVAMQQGESTNPGMMTVVFPPLTVIQSKSLIVFCTVLDTSYSATAIDNRTSINFQFTLVAFGTFRRLMTASYREMSFSVFPLAQGFHVFAKWAVATANTDVISVFTDDMLDTDYVVSTWTDCCSATAFILVSALDVSSTTVTVSLPSSFSSVVTAGGQNYTSDFTLQLALREVITMTSAGDLTGTRITGSDAILVQSGSTTAAVQGTKTGQLIETLPPLSNQGTLHFGVPTTGRSSDVYRLVGSSSSTTVTIQEDGVLSLTITLTSSNPFYDHIATQPVIISSSNPLLVTRFASSDDDSNVPPAMTFIPSTDHWASYYVIKEVDGSLTRPEYVSLVILTSYTGGVRITYDNQTQISVTGWSTFQSDVTYSYVTMSITETVLLDHDVGQGFMVFQYGVTSNWAYSFVPVFAPSPTPSSTTTAFSNITDSTTTDSVTSLLSSSTSSSSSSSQPGSNNNSTSSVNTTDSSTNGTESSSAYSWLDEPVNKFIVAMAVTLPVVGVVSVVVWRVMFASQVAEAAATAATATTTTTTTTTTTKSIPSAFGADVTSASAPPVNSQLPLAEKKGLTIVEL